MTKPGEPQVPSAGGQARGNAEGEQALAPAHDAVVAIDGPAGSGKSTVARSVAERTALRYLDTGSTYRAMTLALLRRGTPVDDREAVAEAARTVGIGLELDPHPGAVSRVLLDGVPLPPEQLRSPEVNAAVSAVSAAPAVRRRLVALQRSVMAGGGVVAEGRDVGTVVCPEAQVKVFLTASANERARRRGGPDGAGESAEQVARRDRLDSSRSASPTRASEGALVIDSTSRPVDDVVDEIVRLVEAVRARRAR
ncbi:MAG TPA: (d)CMP kinase [Actinomycetes bacterium]|jgi:cytidylate kinase|nr:(d)CMP kinase [Actinomycetes bacterium]